MDSFARHNAGVYILARNDENPRVDADIYCLFRATAYQKAAVTAATSARLSGMKVAVHDGTAEPAQLLSQLARFGTVIGDRRRSPRR
ncbi:MAG TPA: hypothetical protein VFV47_03340 [Hyphomicrobiaceae bacterium]|nr:hypothetical protein [Hyphomicrobiaceae bacterium]